MLGGFAVVDKEKTVFDLFVDSILQTAEQLFFKIVVQLSNFKQKKNNVAFNDKLFSTRKCKLTEMI